MTPNYADRSRSRSSARPLPRPRNIKAADQAFDQDLPLVISFVDYAPWSNPTIYCDSGVRYDWGFLQGQLTVVAVKPGVDTRDALAEILSRTDTVGTGYPVLVDVELREVACVVDGNPGGLWQMRSGSDLWQQYFASP